MAGADPGYPTASRRAFLGGVAGVMGGATAPGISTASAPTLTVMTRNLYVGIDLFDLYSVDSYGGLRRTTGELLETITSHPFSARMEAITTEIEDTEPDVVALQEAVTIRAQQPSDFISKPFPNADDVIVDLLELFVAHLDTRGLKYEIAVEQITTDIEVPADVDGEEIDVRLTDRTVVLVRRGLEVANTASGKFENAYSIGTERITLFAIRRGYCLVDLSVGGAIVTIATTHLESADDGVRWAQAGELLDHLSPDRPVILAGDFNSGPQTDPAAYDLLTESFDDAHTVLHGETTGGTCCHRTDLRNETARLAYRIDGILYRGGVRPTASHRMGVDPADRVAVERGGETVRLWPSDHAGVVATFELTSSTDSAMAATPISEVSSPTRTPSSVQLDGFGPALAVVAALAAVLAREWWRT